MSNHASAASTMLERYFRLLGPQQGARAEAFKFLVVGGLNFVLTFIVFFLMVVVLDINHLVGLATSWAFGLVFSYALNFIWVFRPEHRFRFNQRFIKYFLASLASLLLNMLALEYIVTKYRLDPFLVQCALIPLIVVTNFLTAKFWSLRSRRHASKK